MEDGTEPLVSVSAAEIAQALGARDLQILVLKADVARLTAELAALKATGQEPRGEVIPS